MERLRNSSPRSSFATFVFAFSSPLVGFSLFSSSTPTPFFCCSSYLYHNVPEMFSSTRMITAVFAALALASTGFAAPAPADGDVSSLSARAVAPTSRFVIYSDNWVTGVLPPATQLKVSVICIRTISFPGTITNIRLHVGLQRRRALIPHPPRRTRPGRQVRRPLPRRQDSKAERIPQRRHQDRRVRIRRDRHPHVLRRERRKHCEHDGAVGQD